jgi:aldehyde dehydrogenase (NAD+)
VKVRVDQAKCEGHALCHGQAPDLFTLDDDGYSDVDVKAVPPGMEEVARGGVLACPERAITLEERPFPQMLGTAPMTRREIFIGEGWVPSMAAATLTVIDPTTEEALATIPEGTVADVDAAVDAAKAAFPAWAKTSRDERCGLLTEVGAVLAARRDEIDALICRQVGTPYGASKGVQVNLALEVFAGLESAVARVTWQEELDNSLVVREPIGVVGAITPWNYPFYQAVLKVVHALAAGCTVVLKPSEVAPLDSFILAEAIQAAGLPAGVFNLIMGTGRIAGEAIASHPDVDAISFTGSTRAGVRVMQLGAETVKRVNLELGGKSASIILADAELDQAVAATVQGCFFNSGQSCTALSRMIVPRSKLTEIEELTIAAASGYKVGDPFSEGVRIGPLVSDAQRQRVRSHIRRGVQEGARLLLGGAEPPEGLDTGFFVKPTVFSDVHSTMTIAQEEIFGPVLAILPVDSEVEAIEVANDTSYGLSGAVWAKNQDRAMAVASEMRSGQVQINGGAFNSDAPFGGHKRSGNGREHGRYGIEEFLEFKALQR